MQLLDIKKKVFFASLEAVFTFRKWSFIRTNAHTHPHLKVEATDICLSILRYFTGESLNFLRAAKLTSDLYTHSYCGFKDLSISFFLSIHCHYKIEMCCYN